MEYDIFIVLLDLGDCHEEKETQMICWTRESAMEFINRERESQYQLFYIEQWRGSTNEVQWHFITSETV